ncbi:Acetaldehyde dehydrogenase [compost metagenome]
MRGDQDVLAENASCGCFVLGGPAQIIAWIASKSAGLGTRSNIEELTETTSKAIEVIGDASKAKAIITRNPA